MNSTSSEKGTLEPSLSLPIEVNVIILNQNGVPIIPSSIYPVNYHQDEKNDSVVLNSEDHPDHIMQDIITDETKNGSCDDDVFINIDNDTETELTDTTNMSNLDTPLLAEVENTNSSIGELCTGTPQKSADNDSARECCKDVSHAKIFDQSLEGSETLNRFLDDLYEKEVDLGCNFSDQETNDIRAAVNKQVNIIAQRIHEVDSRLKIQEVLPVGSSREGTQIVRPCEYDFILILDALSKPGAVKIVPEDPESDSREYMHVKLNDNNVKSIFNEFSNNDYIRASCLLPWDRYGLRDFFSAAVSQVVMLCPRSFVTMDTGKLKLKRSKPELNGPACTIQLLWERATIQDKTAMEMLISIDLCPAIRLDFEEYYQLLPTSAKAVSIDLSDDCSTDSVRSTKKSTESVLQSADKSVAKDLDHEAPLETCGFNPARSDEFVVSLFGTEVPNHLDHVKSTKPVLSPSRNINAKDLDYAKSIKSILLMPRDDMRFKVTFTDAELTLLLNMSEHHRKCYKLLKYLINGEPTPLQRHRYWRIKKLFDYVIGFRPSYFHSYLIKQAVWDHHYIQQCNEEVNLGLCVTRTLSKLYYHDYRQDIIHPFNNDMRIYTSKFEGTYIGYSSLTAISIAFDAIKRLQKDDYDYEYCRRNLTKGRRPIVCLRVFLCLACCIVVVSPAISVFIKCLEIRNDLPHIIYLLSGYMLSLLCIVFLLYLLYLRDAFYSKWKLLAQRLSLCTEHIELWIICNLLAISLVLMVVKFGWGLILCMTAIVFTCIRLKGVPSWLQRLS